MVTKGSVLVVDDEINLCRILGAKLAKVGYNVVAVHDGVQAVEKVRESDFDVVLLDLILPKKDGLSALAEIRSVRNSLPVIVMTACENADALQQARTHGVSAYVNKPFDLDSLVTLVQETSQSGTSGRDNRLPETTVLFVKDQPVTVEVQNGSGAKVYSSSIHHKDDRALAVLAPECDGYTVEVPPRTSVRVGLAAKDAYYSFTSHVLRCDTASESVLVIEKPAVIYRSQRREHVRVPVRIPLEYALCSDEGEGSSAFRPGETRDLSFSGALIEVPDEVLPGEMLRVNLRPKTAKDVISATAQVLRSRPAGEGLNSYVLGCRFTSAEDSIRELLKG